MTTWLLSHLKDSPTAELLKSASKQAKFNLIERNPSELSCRFTKDVVEFFENGELIDPPDCVLLRTGGSAQQAHLDVARYIESLGIPVINSVAVTETCRDKIATYAQLNRCRIPIPETLILFESKLPSVAELPRSPWIVKPSVGAKGEGVVSVHSYDELHTVIEGATGKRLIVQSLIKGSYGVDIRVLVLGGKAIAAMRRQSTNNDVRSNLHQGGIAAFETVTEEMARVAEGAANAVSAQLAGVDLLLDDSGYLVCEVNSSPGIEGLMSVGNEDVNFKILDYLRKFSLEIE